jgi:hypothetical protein
MCSTIIGARYGSKSFMACCVPYLQLYFIGINSKLFEAKIDSNGGHKNLTKLIIGVSDENGRFSDGRVAHKDDLE